jgi:hypothetical protein
LLDSSWILLSAATVGGVLRFGVPGLELTVDGAGESCAGVEEAVAMARGAIADAG